MLRIKKIVAKLKFNSSSSRIEEAGDTKKKKTKLGHERTLRGRTYFAFIQFSFYYNLIHPVHLNNFPFGKEWRNCVAAVKENGIFVSISINIWKHYQPVSTLICAYITGIRKVI